MQFFLFAFFSFLQLTMNGKKKELLNKMSATFNAASSFRLLFNVIKHCCLIRCLFPPLSLSLHLTCTFPRSIVTSLYICICCCICISVYLCICSSLGQRQLLTSMFRCSSDAKRSAIMFICYKVFLCEICLSHRFLFPLLH